MEILSPNVGRSNVKTITFVENNKNNKREAWVHKSYEQNWGNTHCVKPGRRASMDKARHISKPMGRVSEIWTPCLDGWKFESEDPDRMDEVSSGPDTSGCAWA
jgi:hypothetical protein